MSAGVQVNITDIFGRLCGHLSAGGGIGHVSEEFKNLESNCEKVDFVLALLRSCEITPVYDRKTWKKSDVISSELRDKGNEMYAARLLDQAIELYTKSIIYAEKDSEAWGLGYGNRSAALFEKGLYSDCIQDIDEAVNCAKASKVFEKLNRRKLSAINKLDDHVEMKIFEEIPVLRSERNPYIPCATNSVAIKTSTEEGRHVVATKDIQIGDVIAIETPYVALVIPHASRNHCHNCLKVSYSLQPCENCLYALYCSNACKEEAMDLAHKYECPIMGMLLQLNITKLNLIALRVVFTARKEFGKIGSLSRKSQTIESGRYEEIHNLCTNSEKRSNADIFDRALTAAVIYEMVLEHTTFFSDVGDGAQDTFKTLLLHHMQTAASNFHEISELVVRGDGNSDTVEIGSGAFSFLSMFNHSCSPNVIRNCYGTTIVVRALSPIKKGQQLFDNYGYHYAVMSQIDRHKRLKAQYFFDCTCEACTRAWPMYDELPVKNFDFEVPDETFAELKSGSVQTARETLSNFLIKAAILEKMKPCRQLADMQECVKQCYFIMGNKSRL